MMLYRVLARLLSYPDNGIFSQVEQIEQAARIAAAIDIPLIADADTLGETVADAFHFTRRYVRAGIAGFHVEDEVNPKHSTWSNGLIPIADMQARIDACVRARGDSDLVIITAGIARKPGMSRDDLLNTNAGIVKQVSEQVKRTSPNAVVIVVSNPLDVMCWVAKEVTGFPRERVIGMAGVLDTARYRAFLAEALDVSVRDIQAMVLGGHGDTMVPVLSYCTINGVPAKQFIPADKLAAIVDRARNGGGEIVKLMGTSAYYAPASSAIAMTEAYLRDEKRMLPAAAYLEGEYGYIDIYMGVPVIIGGEGVEKIVTIELEANEKAMLDNWFRTRLAAYALG